MTIKDCLELFKTSAISDNNKEIIAFLGLKEGSAELKLIKNRSPDPQNYFAVDPLEFLEFKSNYLFLAVLHSHIYGDSQFSAFDEATSENCCLPFVVYSVPEGKFALYVPESNELDSVNLSRLKDAL